MTTSQVSDIYNFLAISDDLGTAGQPTAEQVAALKTAGYEVVINLALGTTPRDLPHEADLVTGHGMDYIHIPVIFDNPTDTDLQRFFEAMQANQEKKCFVHCIANMRVSAFVFLYRVLQQGVAPDEAHALLHKIWQPNAVWQRFIDDALA
jgi:protein tyrosine phosphatase (PTP) superfamily phosphohydrolase (DUF442 family)